MAGRPVPAAGPVLPEDDLARAWRAARPPAGLVHLDSAAAGRASARVLEAESAHLLLEAEVGGYVAQEEAAPRLAAARAAAGTLVGLGADDVALVESAHTAMATLLACWPLPPGARVAVARSEWARNRRLARSRGAEVVEVPADGCGLVDTGALDARLRSDPPDLLLLSAVPAHRGVVQPLADVAALCAQAGVPLVVDAAQGLGHVDCAVGAAAVVATSRKWLAGPRGVGLLAVAPAWAGRLLTGGPALDPADLPDAPPVARLASLEAHVAGQVGLGQALAEHLAAGPSRVRERLALTGRATRQVLDGVAGWRATEPEDAATAITTLLPPDGVDVAATRARLLAEDGVLVSAVPASRAPADLAGPVLRVSPHLDARTEDLEVLARALHRLTR